MSRLLMISVLVVIAFRSSIAQANDSWNKVNTAGKGVLSVTYFDSPGLITKDGVAMKGLCVDILNDFVLFVKANYKKDLTIKYVSAEKDFQQFLNKVQASDNLLGVTGINITESRKQIFKFTPSYLTAPTVLITGKDVSSITQPKDLINLEPFSLAKGTHHDVVKDLLKQAGSSKTINQLSSPEEVLKQIHGNQKAFTVLGINDYLEAVRKGLNVKVQSLKVGEPEIFGFIMPKKSDWDIPWNAFLTDAYLSSPEYRKSISSNLGSALLDFVRKQK